MQVGGYSLQVGGYSLQVGGYSLQVGGYSLQVGGYSLQVGGCGLFAGARWVGVVYWMKVSGCGLLGKLQCECGLVDVILSLYSHFYFGFPGYPGTVQLFEQTTPP